MATVAPVPGLSSNVELSQQLRGRPLGGRAWVSTGQATGPKVSQQGLTASVRRSHRGRWVPWAQSLSQDQHLRVHMCTHTQVHTSVYLHTCRDTCAHRVDHEKWRCYSSHLCPSPAWTPPLFHHPPSISPSPPPASPPHKAPCQSIPSNHSQHSGKHEVPTLWLMGLVTQQALAKPHNKVVPWRSEVGVGTWQGENSLNAVKTQRGVGEEQRWEGTSRV